MALTSDTPLRAEHDRIVGWLRRGANAPQVHCPGKPNIDDIDDRVLSTARRLWTSRMKNEHRSAAVFTGLVPQLMACGAPLPYMTTATRMAADELHHGGLCADVVKALGGASMRPARFAPTPLPEHPGCTPLERTFRNIMFVSCLAETFAVATTTEEREQTTDPYLKQVIGQISADEVLHARFGWAFVKDAADELSADEKQATSHWLRLAFCFLEREAMLEIPNVAPPSAEMMEQGFAVGVCNNQATRELFYQTVQSIIVPGLEAVGLRAMQSWERRREWSVQ